MASFSLCIKAAPFSAAALHGLEFARACIRQGHSIVRVFFYGEGVYLGLKTQLMPQGELSLGDEWQQFLIEHQIDAVVCIAAAVRRGVLDAAEAARSGFPVGLLREGFSLSGLGQWVAANTEADHAVTFG
ncbi:MAG TPA: sulfurtransferase complex subunit TusD [Cellvibrionaceae bacterium]|nr:sulfurtransferase complex subunit TusD [Cellvibrionaceae bacterium]